MPGSPKKRAPKYERKAEPCVIAKNHSESPAVAKDRDSRIHAALDLIERHGATVQ